MQLQVRQALCIISIPEPEPENSSQDVDMAENAENAENADTSKETSSPTESSVDKDSSEPPAEDVNEGQQGDATVTVFSTTEEEVRSKVTEEGNKDEEKEEEKEEEEDAQFPNTLEGFGYHFEGKFILRVSYASLYIVHFKRALNIICTRCIGHLKYFSILATFYRWQTEEYQNRRGVCV